MPIRLLAALLLALSLAVLQDGRTMAATPAAPAHRPLVVILADPEGTVATDLFSPYAILAESGAVDVRVVSPTAAPVRLTPGVAWVKPQLTLAELDRLGRPDVIVVPAMERDDDPARSAWLRAQLKKGARIMSICNGARVLAAAGVLDGRQATVHWYSQGKVAKRYPGVHWRRDARWVEDGPVMTTAGISAGEPGSLHLLERLAGREVMAATAARLGLPLPDVRHDGRAYRLDMARRGVVVGNILAFWNHEKVALPLTPGFDEIALGTGLDAWSRTFRSKAWATGAAATRSAHGLVVYRSAAPPARFDRTAALARPDVMANTFEQIRRAYGEPTARFVGLQFEHPYGLVP